MFIDALLLVYDKKNCLGKYYPPRCPKEDNVSMISLFHCHFFFSCSWLYVTDVQLVACDGYAVGCM